MSRAHRRMKREQWKEGRTKKIKSKDGQTYRMKLTWASFLSKVYKLKKRYVGRDTGRGWKWA